jgi:hypothetical protein
MLRHFGYFHVPNGHVFPSQILDYRNSADTARRYHEIKGNSFDDFGQAIESQLVV